ncbi:MAG TPA: DUF58 domain-containing protein [Gaiellaceae bacterium]|nr:DUF58 domain-containing protein [Gaiellaceae bacterium]
MTRRGRLTLALGCVLYAAAWLLGARTLYPVAIGLVAGALAAALWVRAARRPASVSRRAGRDVQLEGDDVMLVLRAQLTRGLRPAVLSVTERLGRLGEHRIALTPHGGFATGRITLRRVPRGRYAFTGASATVEDPFGLACGESPIGDGGALLVHPRLVELAGVFTESGTRGAGGRRLLLRRPSGFDFHGVREHQQGESLRRVHWPSTAKRGALMVKDFEDAPRDELAILLDAAGAPAGPSFDVQVRAAGSLLRAFATAGRAALLALNRAQPEYHHVASERDWHAAYDALAAAEPDGIKSAAALLGAEDGPLTRLGELVVVTAAVPRALADRLVERASGGRRVALVFVDAGSFSGRSAVPTADLLRLSAAGVAVAVAASGDDLAQVLGDRPLRAAAGA